MDNGDVDCDIQVWVETVGNPGHVAFDFGDVKVPDCDDGAGTLGDCTFDNGNLDPTTQIVQFDVFEPASCTPLRRHTRFDADNDGVGELDDPLVGIITALNTDLPVVEWVEVNRGAMFFDADGVLETVAGGIATVVGGSIQLEPVGCDTDGDGIADVEESTAACALDPECGA